ncbi:MAG: VWD domain-containing protein [Acidimicrobiales bacterium]
MQPDKPTPTTKTVANGGEADLGPVQPYGADVYEIPGGGEGGGTIADIVELSPELGHARVRDDGGVDQLLSPGDTLHLCFRTGGCTCPSGSAGDGVPTVDATPPVKAGVAGRKGGNVLAQGLSLDEFCKQPKRPRQTPPPCGASCGYDSADPHLRTYDGRRYDLQTVGEHWLTRTADGSFGVQVRQEPVTGSRLASRNTAVATRVGRDRVTVTQEGEDRVLRVNGQERLQTDIPVDGGRVTYEVGSQGYGYAIRRDDGSTVTVLPAGRAGLSVYVDPAPDLRGRLEGLLGDDDGDPGNDLVARDGQDLGPSASAADIHRRFGPSWKVGTESWFDYASGTTTTSYDDPTFPDVLPVDASPVGLDQARQRCRDAGISDDETLQACAFDLAVTSDDSLTGAHARDAAVVTAAQGEGTSTTTTIEGEVTNPDDQPTTTFDGRAGDVVGIGRNDGCVDSSLPFQLQNPDGTQLALQTGCNMGRVVLPQDGTYTLLANHFKERTGPYRIELVRVRPDRTADIEPGATLTGTIQQHFEHDVYRLDGRAGQVIVIGGEGCTAGVTLGIELAGGTFGGGGPACSVGRYVIPSDGTLSLVVNTADNGTGAYRIPVRSG